MDYILINNRRLYFDTRIQTGLTGREFEMSRTEQVFTEPPIWNSKQRDYCRWWIHRFTYLDNREEYFEIKINAMKGERYYKVKDKEWKRIT